jgi:hypothetical protein
MEIKTKAGHNDDIFDNHAIIEKITKTPFVTLFLDVKETTVGLKVQGRC